MGNAILVEDLTKRFGDREVVCKVSFSVDVGEIFGFLGPNGAGKTTSIRMMIGEIPRDSGRIEVMGLPVPEAQTQLKLLMGVVPDHQNLYDRLTVRQNFTLFAKLYGIPIKRVDEMIELVDLKSHADMLASELSRGLRQRTLIGRGLLHGPKVFFLDEPTSALDPHSAKGIRNLIESLKSMGTTVLLTTHYMEEANNLCDHIAIIHHGSIVAVDTPDALKMRFGKPTMEVTLSCENGKPFEVIEVPLNDSLGAKTLSHLLESKRVIKIHSQEATLEEVFMNLTGDSWKEDLCKGPSGKNNHVCQ
ncbi:ABC transporter ATP-binding protein [bacterium]|nr:ABC transporter ATP-binding protein [bacterium]